jgi:hypothetical protein
LIELPQQDVVAGGGGPISNEELWAALQLPRDEGDGPRELRVRPQSVIHTDSARAYFNLGLREADLPPRDADRAANPGEGPAQQAARFAAEAAEGLRPPVHDDDLPLAILAERLRPPPPPPPPPPPRSVPEWRARYAPFGFAHTAVCHTSKAGGRRRQFVARRQVHLGDGRTVWLKGGTQTIDGHWALLKKHVSRCGVNTGRLQLLRELVRGHQWRHWEGPGVCKFSALGPALREQLAREAHEDRAAGRAELREIARAEALSQRQAQRAAAAAARPSQRLKLQRQQEAPPPLALQDQPAVEPAAPAAEVPRVEPLPDASPPKRRRLRRLLSPVAEAAALPAQPPCPALADPATGAAAQEQVWAAVQQAQAAAAAANRALELALGAARQVGLPGQ